MIIDKMMVGTHARPSWGREAAELRKLKGVLKIVHMDLQCVVKVDVMEIIYFAFLPIHVVAYLRFSRIRDKTLEACRDDVGLDHDELQ